MSKVIANDIIDELFRLINLYSCDTITISRETYRIDDETIQYFPHAYHKSEENMNFVNVIISLHHYCYEHYGVDVPLPEGDRRNYYLLFRHISHIFLYHYRYVTGILEEEA